MPLLRAAVSGAREFEGWAKAQGCETRLFVDDRKPVTASAILQTINRYIAKNVYRQLIVYFAGHGVLLQASSEYWLLSGAAENPNEAVNVSRNKDESRGSGIPHVVLISDACRTYPTGSEWSSLFGAGAVIFKNDLGRRPRSAVDVFYATVPGLAAYEGPNPSTPGTYDGLFTRSLLEAVESPEPDWLVTVPDGRSKLTVIPSRPLKVHLEAVVPELAERLGVAFDQEPEAQVESDPPAFFGRVTAGDPAAEAAPPAPVSPPEPTPPAAPDDASEREEARDHGDGGAERAGAGAAGEKRHLDFGEVWDHLRSLPNLAAVIASAPVLLRPTLGAGVDVGSRLEVDLARILHPHGLELPANETGFTVLGTAPVRALAPGWNTDARPASDYDVDLSRWDILLERTLEAGRTILISFGDEQSTVLPVLPGFIGVVDVANDRVANVNYVPSPATERYRQYTTRFKEVEALKALITVATRNGRLAFHEADASELASRIRQAKGIDPTMGLYAAYAYAQVGKFDQAYSVYRYMARDDSELPLLFDVVMLASRHRPQVVGQAGQRLAPLLPMLGQGWALLQRGDALYREVHGELSSHVLPALWTTFAAEGTKRAQALLEEGQLG